jgi:hypothetical protein
MYRMRVIGLVDTQAQMIRQLSPVITFCSMLRKWLQYCCSSLAVLLTATHLSQLQFANHLIQIGTGEGKSITLTVTSCILALLGSMWTALATIHI